MTGTPLQGGNQFLRSLPGIINYSKVDCELWLEDRHCHPMEDWSILVFGSRILGKSAAGWLETDTTFWSGPSSRWIICVL